MAKTQDQTALLIARGLEIDKLKSQKKEMREATRGDRFGVYAYLREDGTPYYVGRMSSDSRAFSKDHAVGIPPDPRRVRMLKGNLSREEANAWEKKYIARYGRKGIDPGGILRQRRSGGEGGDFPRPEVAERLGLDYATYAGLDKRQKQAMTKWLRNNPGKSASDWLSSVSVRGGEYRSEVAKAGAQSRTEAAARRMGLSPEQWNALSRGEKAMVYQRFKIGKRGAELLESKGEVVTDRIVETAKKYGVSVKKWQSLSDAERKLAKERYGNGVRGKALFAPSGSTFSKATLAAAEKYGVDPEWWSKLSAKERMRVSGRYIRGVRGAALLEGLL